MTADRIEGYRPKSIQLVNRCESHAAVSDRYPDIERQTTNRLHISAWPGDILVASELQVTLPATTIRAGQRHPCGHSWERQT